MRMRDLRRKEVINVTDGGRLGFVGDVDFRLPDGQAAALDCLRRAALFRAFRQGRGVLRALGVHPAHRG